jgi:hypothetical protein
MPLLRFDAPDVPPIPEDVASLEPPRANPVTVELPAAEVPADVFNLMDFDVLDAGSTPEPDEQEPEDIDILL